MRKTLYILLMLTSLAGRSQVFSSKGRFSADFNRACDPFTISVRDLTNSVNPAPQYIFEADIDGFPETPDTEYTYTAPGTYTIVQILEAGFPGGNLDTLIVEILEPVRPLVDFSFCDNTTINLLIADSLPYDSYEVYIGADTIQVAPGQYSTEVPLPQDQESTITLRGKYENALNNCATTSFNVSPRPASFAYDFENLDIQYLCDDEIALILTGTPAANTYYRIQYQNGSYSENVYEGMIGTDSLYFDALPLLSPDADICLQVDAVAVCSNQVVPGETYCDQLPANFSAIDEAYATYNEDYSIDLYFENNENGAVTIEKIAEDVVVQTWDSIAVSNIFDNSVSPIRDYDYVFMFTPACGAAEQRLTISAPYIRTETIAPNAYEIEWEPGEYLLTGEPLNELVIEDAQDPGNNRIIESPSNPIRINLDEQTGENQIIRFKQRFSDLETQLLSNPLAVAYEYVVYVPKAFTPNDDGLNDRLEIYGLPSDDFTMTIFNKWGEPVHRFSELSNTWDGRLSNRVADYGVYTYYIEFKNSRGATYSQRGSFILLKN